MVTLYHKVGIFKPPKVGKGEPKFIGSKYSKKKISPYLVPREDLPEYTNDYDRDPVKAIPEKLAKYGYEIYRDV